MNVSAWAPVAAMWIVFAVLAVVGRDWLAAWMALACAGLSVLSAMVDRFSRREVSALRSMNQILAAQVRYHEKGTNVDHR